MVLDVSQFSAVEIGDAIAPLLIVLAIAYSGFMVIRWMIIVLNAQMGKQKKDLGTGFWIVIFTDVIFAMLLWFVYLAREYFVSKFILGI